MQVSKLFSYLSSKNCCNCVKHIYRYGMTRADFIYKFKNHINIGGKNHVAYADAALVEVFFNSHIVKNTVIMTCFILVCSVETLNIVQN